jgi:ribosomal protein S18 acetylase RimI-like enzyme
LCADHQRLDEHDRSATGVGTAGVGKLDGESGFLTDTSIEAETAQHVLDRVVAASLAGQHTRFARRHGLAVRYESDVTPFMAVDDERDPAAWDDAAALVEEGETVAFPGLSTWPSESPDWKLLVKLEGVQMVGTEVSPKSDPEAVLLGPDDVPEILDLIARTEPGPFLGRTIELGSYLGIRRDGALVAMAGERMHPPGWTEVSAVCTDPAYRGRGLAGRLVRAVAAGIVERGETPFLHAAATNENAIRLYRSLGFAERRAMPFTVLQR